MFDENGKMKTGWVVYNGKTYYFEEIGFWRGATVTGKITVNGKTIEFNDKGELQ